MSLEQLQHGRYRSSRLLGSGGMGEVYLMQDERVQRQVAIKVIRSENTSTLDSKATADAARLFQREAKAIAALEHPNILPLYDFGEELSEDTTVSYMVMPYCTEGSLASWLRHRTGSQLSPRDIAALIEQAAEALQYAHDHDVIHLDVKASNFLLRENKKNPNRPHLLLADFGIARSSATVASSSRTIRGTPTAMAPEQWTSNPVAATDQYALATMAYEMLTGRPPFVGSMEQLMYQHLSVQPPAPSTFNPLLPKGVDPVLLRALAKRPEDRFPSVAAFASALQEAVESAQPETGQQAQQGDIEAYTTLMISKQEADAGISRLLTLPGGEQINVPIPAGTQNGQIIRLPSPTGASHQSSPLVLNVIVKPPDETPPAKVVNTGQPQPVTPPASLERVSEHNLPTMAVGASSSVQAPAQPPTGRKSLGLRFGIISIISVIVLVLLASGVLFYLGATRSASQQLGASALHSSSTITASTKAVTQIPTSTPTPSITPTPTPQDGLYIPGTYNGSMFNQNTQQTTSISVYLVQSRGNGALSGSVTFKSPTQGTYPLTGTVDVKGNFSFSVQQPASQQPLLFLGAVQQQQDGNYLKGNFCNTTATSCIALSGYFYVGPGY